MTPPTLRAIKCSERMPTREDASEWREVLWLCIEGGVVIFAEAESYNSMHYFGTSLPVPATHWHPLNRSAIATDAEEQT